MIIGYHIQRIDKKTKRVATRIGERVIEMRKDTPDLLSHDEEMVGIFTGLDKLLTARKKYVKERKAIKDRRKRRPRRYGVVVEPEAAKA